jgi:hypothetical protein
MLLVRWLFCVGCTCSSGAVYAADCSALLGEWNWFTGGTVNLKGDHTILYDGREAGHWTCTDDASNKATLRWSIGAVDSVRVSGDHLTGTNTQGVSISAERGSMAHVEPTKKQPTEVTVPFMPVTSSPNALQRCLGIAQNQPWPNKIGPRPDTAQFCQQLPAWAVYEQAQQAFNAKHHAEAAERLLSAAQAGNGLAASRLAIMYVQGDGVPVNKQEAFRWYQAAAQAGDPRAADDVGSFYEAGMAGVAEDWIQAARWYQESARMGWPKGQQSLGRAYQYGVGVPLNLSTAVEWYERAAAGGNGKARYFAQYLKDNHGLDGSTMSEEEAALYGSLLRSLAHTIAPPAGTVFHNKEERLTYIRTGVNRIAWQEYDDCRRVTPGGPPRTCIAPSAPRP